MTIASTIQKDGRRYKFTHEPVVHDLGLRLEQALEMGLESEEFQFPARQKKDPRENLLACGATEGEIKFLVQHGNPSSGGWRGQRIELNAMTAPQFIEFVHGQLEALGLEKVVPDGETLAAAFRQMRAAEVLEERVNTLIAKQLAECDSEVLTTPDDLPNQVADMIRGTSLSWEDALQRIAREAG